MEGGKKEAVLWLGEQWSDHDGRPKVKVELIHHPFSWDPCGYIPSSTVWNPLYSILFPPSFFLILSPQALLMRHPICNFEMKTSSDLRHLLCSSHEKKKRLWPMDGPEGDQRCQNTIAHSIHILWNDIRIYGWQKKRGVIGQKITYIRR